MRAAPEGGAELYREYQLATEHARDARARSSAALAKERADYFEALRVHYAAKRQAVGASVAPRFRRVEYQAIAGERARDMQTAKAHFAAKRGGPLPALPSWVEFLIDRASAGDDRALTVLRRRSNKERAAFGNCLAVKDMAKARDVLRKEFRPVVSRDGAARYRVSDGGRVDDAAGGVRVERATENATTLALILAAARFGDAPLEVDGSKAFRVSVARAAGLAGVAVTFADEALEQERKWAAPAAPSSPVPSPTDPVGAYIQERNALRGRVSDIEEHRAWSPALAGSFAFRGRRTVGGVSVALLGRDDAVFVLPIDGETLGMVNGLRRGAQLDVRADGSVVVQRVQTRGR